jgi:hypothetical protein
MTATSEPTSITDALANANWKKAMDIEYDALMKNKPGILFLHVVVRILLTVVGYTRKNGKLMALLINIRLVSLLKVINNGTVLIMKTLSVL